MRKIRDFSAYRTFTGAKVGLGRCGACWAGKAVYRSQEAQAKGWEERLPRREGVRAPLGAKYYARLVRERNERAEVR